MSSRATLSSVAERAGTSRQTVSNVLNAPDRVSPATRERVQAAIDATGYRPHVAARQLRTRRSMNVGLRLMPLQDGINGSILDAFVHALTENAAHAGYRLVIFSAPDDDGEIAAYDELLETADLDAFVLTSTHHRDRRTRWLLDHEVPFATFGRPWSAGVDPRDSVHQWVDVDGRAGAAAATRHLRGLGHERIGFLGWPAGSGAGDERRAGWRDVLGDDAVLDEAVTDGVRQGSDAAARLLDAGATALVCASDSLALGAFHRTTAVVGFDDTPVAAAVGMSSVAQPVEAAAAHVVAMLARTLGDPVPPVLPSTPDRHVLLEPRLVVRDEPVALAHP